MKIINSVTGETVAEITTNHSMSLDEAINLVGEIITPEKPFDAAALIGGNLYYYDDLALETIWPWSGNNRFAPRRAAYPGNKTRR